MIFACVSFGRSFRSCIVGCTAISQKGTGRFARVFRFFVDPFYSGMIEASGIEEQTRQVIRNLEAVLKASGSSLERVVKTTCFLKNIGDFAVFNSIYAEAFTSKPARSCVEAAALQPPCISPRRASE